MSDTRASRSQLIPRLQANPFFAGLDETMLQELAQTAVWREYNSGEIVVLEGEALSGLYYLQHGWLKVVKISP
ncbi:MAG TPA: cyclic nucleotide-binding domain-containing protein, partial [Anaerolineae bacterium]|nr:cyclic nucleotide-binding domain-containing protein [Anaerolineae bacterium]